MTAPEGAAPEPVAAITDAAARQQVEEAGRLAKAAALKLATLNTQTKNDALLLTAEECGDLLVVSDASYCSQRIGQGGARAGGVTGVRYLPVCDGPGTGGPNRPSLRVELDG